MKSFRLNILLFACTFFTIVIGKTLSCKNIKDHFGDRQCLLDPAKLLIRDFWLEQSRKLDDNRQYDNYDKIICAPDDAFKMCAFVEGLKRDVDWRVPGKQIKKLVELLAKSCDLSRCGQVNVDQVDGIARGGVFKIAGVAQMGACHNVCSETECTFLKNISASIIADSL